MTQELFRIRTLEWSEGDYVFGRSDDGFPGVYAWTSETVFGTLEVSSVCRQHFYCAFGTLEVSSVCRQHFYCALREVRDKSVIRHHIDSMFKHDTLDAAKAAAEQWYRERLSSALIPATPNEIAESFFALPVESVTTDMPSIGGMMSAAEYLSHAADGHIPSQRSFENRSDPNRQDRSPQ